MGSAWFRAVVRVLGARGEGIFVGLERLGKRRKRPFFGLEAWKTPKKVPSGTKKVLVLGLRGLDNTEKGTFFCQKKRKRCLFGA